MMKPARHKTAAGSLAWSIFAFVLIVLGAATAWHLERLWSVSRISSSAR